MNRKWLVITLICTAALLSGVGVVATTRTNAAEDRDQATQAPSPEEVAARQAARRLANERSAVQSLRAIAAAETQAHDSAVIDTDGDGIGEFGYLAELAGRVALRSSSPSGIRKLFPALLPRELGELNESGAVETSGYFVALVLPGARERDRTPGLPEVAGGNWIAGGPLPQADAAERLWCAYAWPVEAGVSGTRAFFVDQEDRVLQAADGYGGAGNAPAFDAAYAEGHFGDMQAPLPDPQGIANDGRAWTPID